MPLRPHVPDLQRHLTRKLVLQVQVVIFHVRCADVAINGENIAFHGATARRIEDRLSLNNASRCIRRWNDLGWPNRVVSGTRIVERRIWQMSQEGVLRERIIEDASSGAYYCLALAGYIPRDARARRKILVIRLV